MPLQYTKNRMDLSPKFFTQWTHNFGTHKTDTLYVFKVNISINLYQIFTKQSLIFFFKHLMNFFKILKLWCCFVNYNQFFIKVFTRQFKQILIQLVFHRDVTDRLLFVSLPWLQSIYSLLCLFCFLSTHFQYQARYPFPLFILLIPLPLICIPSVQ